MGLGTYETALVSVPDLAKISVGVYSHVHRDHFQDQAKWRGYAGIICTGPTWIEEGKQYNYGKNNEWSIIPISVKHDVDCFSYFIKSNIENKTIYFATDTYDYSHIIGAMILDYALIECNHDEVMLRNGTYPDYLKKRVAQNHCSLQRCTKAVAKSKCQRFLLAHPSAHNINQEAALQYLRNEFPNRTFNFATPGYCTEF